MPGNNKTVSGLTGDGDTETGSVLSPVNPVVAENTNALGNSEILPMAPENMPGARRDEDMVLSQFPDKPLVDTAEVSSPKPESAFKSVDGVLFPLEPVLEKKKNNYLLLIAIDKYEHLEDLKNPVRDANALLEVLMDRYSFHPETSTFDTPAATDQNGERFEYKVFNTQRIVCLYNEKATLDNIGMALKMLINNMEADSQLLIYFSGHGCIDEDSGDLTITTHDYSENKPSTHQSIDKLTNNTKTGTCRNLLLIVDACHSGSAIFGSKTQSAGAFSREILMSCSHTQLASDGEKYQGSPFSRALVSILKNNGKANSMKLSTLAAEIEGYMTKENEGNAQDVLHGKARESGSETFCFQLEDTIRPPVKLFAESLINHLNFDEERSYFDNDDIVDPQNYSKDYIIISSESVDSSIEKFRGGIISKTVAMKLRKEADFKLKKYPIHFRLNMTDLKSANQIFHFLSIQKNFEGVGIEKNTASASYSDQDRVDYISGLLGTRLAKFEEYDNPQCVSFILENFIPDKDCEIVSEFIFMMIVGIENFKSKNKLTAKWEKLVFFIVSDLGGEIQDTRGFSQDRGYSLTQLFKKTTYAEPIFKWFNKVGPVGYNHVDRWLRSTGNSISASAYMELRKKDKAGNIKSEHFPNKEMITIDKCLNLLCKEVKFTDNQRLELFEIMLFKK